jgi:hypothetical protein
MTLAPYSSADLLESGQYEADRAAELRRCVSRSKEHGQEQIEREAHKARSTAGCGRVALLEDSRNPGAYAAARLRCKRKRCPDCGPLGHRARIGHYLAMMDGYPMRRRRIDPAARRATLAKLRRAGHRWVPIPAPDGALVLYATGGPGELVTDPAATLTADVLASPPGRSIIPCRAWARQPIAQRGSSRWKLDGMAKIPMAQLVKAALDAGIYRHQLATEALPPEWAEAHLLQRPDDELAWRRFRRRIGLHWPERHHRRRSAA